MNLFKTMQGKTFGLIKLQPWVTSLPLLMLFCVAYVGNVDMFNGLTTGKWMAFEIAILLVAITAFVLLAGRFRRDLILGSVDLWLLLLLGYTMVRASSNFNTVFYFTVGIVCVWCYLKLMSDKWFITATIFIYLLAASGQSALGLLQLYGFKNSNHSLFSITGTFHNPGPFAGYLASALPLALGILLFYRPKRSVQPRVIVPSVEKQPGSTKVMDSSKRIITHLRRMPYLKVVTQLTVLLLLIALPATRSRAAWLGAVAGSLFVVCPYLLRIGLYSLRNKTGVMRFVTNKRMLLWVALAFCLSGSIGLYHFKKQSADGRLLMWQVSWQLIKEKPLFGHGWDSFGTMYMSQQASWFAEGKGNDAQIIVAGEPEAPFNEPIRLLIELGLVGLLLVGGLTVALFRAIPPMRSSNMAKYPCVVMQRSIGGALIAIFVFGLFSYPMDCAPIMAQLLVLYALLPALGASGNQISSVASVKLKPTSFLIRKNILPPTASRCVIHSIILLVIIGVVVLAPKRYKYYNAMVQWHEADQLYRLYALEASEQKYADAYSVLHSNGLFLQMYGKCLQMNGSNGKALEVLHEAEQIHNGTIVQLAMGDCYVAMGQNTQAAVAYQRAWHMIPSRLYPGYKLAMHYQNTGQFDLAIATALKVLNMPVKVHSTAVGEIQQAMHGIVGKKNTKKG